MAAAADAPLLGRDAAWAHLARAVERAQAGAGSFLWVRGEAGIGKTSVLEAAVAMAVARGFRVLRGTAWDDPGTPPFWLWVQVLRDAAGRADRSELLDRWGPRAVEALSLLPELSLGSARNADGADLAERFALFDSVESVLDAESGERPLLLALDDLHWTDAGSLHLLRFLTRAPAARPLVVLATWRDEEVVPEAAAVVASELAAHSEQVPLGGLESDAVVELLDRAAGVHVDAGDAERLRERTGGNPLFLIELGRLARDRGAADLAGEVPASAEAIIGRRLARVSQGCHDVLAVAAIAGTANSIGTVAALASRPTTTVVAALDEAVAAGLARDAASRVEIAHPLIRDCLVRSLAPARAREIHLATAGLVGDDPAAAAETAHHLRAALPLGDLARARDASRRAAEVAYAARAYEEAARHRTSELELAGDDPDVRFEALLGRGTALLATGAVAGARNDYIHAADLARSRDDREGFARAALGFAAGMSGFEVRLRDRAQISLLEEALDLLGEEESALRADVMARLSVALSFEDVPHRRTELADAAVDLARRTGSTRSIAHALAAHCDAIAGPDDVERRIDEAGEVIARARESGDRGLEMLGLRLRIVALLETGAVAAARVDVRSFAELAEELGQPLFRCYLPLFRGFLAHLDGDLVGMAEQVQEVEHWGAVSGSLNAAVLAATMRGWIAIEEGRVDDFMSGFRPLLGDVSQLGPNGDAVTALMPGQPDEMRRAAVPYLAEIVAGLSRDSEYLSTFVMLCVGLREQGGPLEAAPILRAALEPHCGRFVVDGIAAGAAGAVDRWVGFLALVQGDLDAAIGHLDRALAVEEAMGARLAVAHGRAHLAEAHLRRGGSGDAERAERHAREARAAYLAMGLTGRAEAVAGATRAPGGEPPADRTVDRSEARARLERAGDVWTLVFGGTSAVVRHVKGMSDLATLLQSRGREIHALDLAGARGPRQGDTGPVLDDAAKTAYRARLAALDEALADAEAAGDAETGTRVTAEREFLLAELGAAYGLGGRSRRSGDDAERARSAATWRLREAIKRIERVHPEAGAHLRLTVRTGIFCAYDPDREIEWEVSSLTS